MKSDSKEKEVKIVGHEKIGEEKSVFSKIQKDIPNILVLLGLYILQGLPLGLASAIPYILQAGSSKASYEMQGTFSLVFWPFSMKLLWAPLVDALYFKKLGRRKSWLIPVQYAIGIDMLVLSSYINEWFGRPEGEPWGPLGEGGPIRIYMLTAAFFGLTFLAATQDIVVDGWALTMLSKQNVSWASTCNTVGQVLGHIIAFMLFLALESPDVANEYIRYEPIPGKGLVSTEDFIYFWGIVFIVATTVVAVFKHEDQREDSVDDQIDAMDSNEYSTSRLSCLDGQIRSRKKKDILVISGNENLAFNADENDEANHSGDKNIYENEIHETDQELNLNLTETYRVMWGVLNLKPIILYIILLFLIKLSFSAAESINTFKLIEYGVAKERLVFLSVLMLPVQMILPLILSKWTMGPRPLSVFSKATMPRILMTLSCIPLVYYLDVFRTVSETPISEVHIAESPVNPSVNNWSPEDFNLLTKMQASGFEEKVELAPKKYQFPIEFYGIVFVQFFFYSIVQNSMFVSIMAFHAKISDPSIGGTYMTLLNTASNLASSLPSTIMLYLVDPLTLRHCDATDTFRAGLVSLNVPPSRYISPSMINSQKTVDYIRQIGSEYIQKNATCKPMVGIEACGLVGGTCHTIIDGYYTELIACFLIGTIAFYTFVRGRLAYLDSLPKSTFCFRLPQRDPATINSSLCGPIRRRRLSSAQ